MSQLWTLGIAASRWSGASGDSKNGSPCAISAVEKLCDWFMTAEYLVRLLEEMMDLKLQQYAESQLKVTPEITALLHDKKQTDRRRLDQIRIELVRFLET